MNPWAITGSSYMSKTIVDLLRDVILTNRVLKRNDKSVLLVGHLEAGVILQFVRGGYMSVSPTLSAVFRAINMDSKVLGQFPYK